MSQDTEIDVFVAVVATLRWAAMHIVLATTYVFVGRAVLEWFAK